MGLERIILLLQQQPQFSNKLSSKCDVYLCTLGEQAEFAGLTLAESLREQLPSLKLQLHSGGGNFKKQLKKADKSGAAIALILGEDELNGKQVTVKHLREKRPQENVSFSHLSTEIERLLAQ